MLRRHALKFPENEKDLLAYGIDLGMSNSTLYRVELPAGTRLGL